MGFEPTHAEHIGLAVQRLNHSATSSHNISHSKLRTLMWQTFCIPLGLECCRYVFMCNDRNVLSCSVASTVTTAYYEWRFVYYTEESDDPILENEKTLRMRLGNRKEFTGLIVSPPRSNVCGFFFFSFGVISFNISWRNCPSFFSKWWASLSLKMLNLRPILLCT